MSNAIRVLVVDDSPVMRELLRHVLCSDPALQVVGFAANGEEALGEIGKLSPDVVTMDIEMPRMDGYEATRRIMATCPVPVVIVSGHVTPEDVAIKFQTVQAGALAAVESPGSPGDARYEILARRLIQTVKLMSEVKVVRRWQWGGPKKEVSNATSEAKSEISPLKSAISTPATGEKPLHSPQIAAHVRDVLEPATRVGRPQIVAIGASTGGPAVLRTILGSLGPNFPLPLVIVQHISPGFLQGMVEWLIQTTGFRTRIALHNEIPLPGYAYFAPDNWHMTIRRYGDKMRIVLSSEPPEDNLRPAVAPLFRSVAATFGAECIGVLLTGMGRDGAAELKVMREAGAITIAQDKASSIVHGMPGEAIALGAARYVLSSEGIAPTLTSLTKSLAR